MPASAEASDSATAFNRWALAGEIAAAITLSARLWSFIMITPGQDWNAARLLPAFMMAAGRSPYFPAMTGPATGWIYGPIMPMLQTPAALAPTLTAAMLIAAGINLAVLLLPILLIADHTARECGLGSHRLAVAVTAIGLLIALPGQAQYFVFVQSDQVAISLSLLSCWVLIRYQDPAPALAFGGAATLAVLAVWTKQIAVAVPLAHAAYLLLVRRDTRACLRYFVWFSVVGIGVSLLMTGLFGADPLCHNLWIVPAGNHLKAARALWWDNPLTLLKEVAPSLVIAVGAWWVAARRPPSGRGVWRAGVRLLFVLALCQLPVDLLGAAKIGGGANSLHLAVTIYLAAILCAIAAAASWKDALPPRYFAWASLGTVLLGWTVTSPAFPLRLTPDPSLEEARILAASHRGQIYFPRNPLVTWWTEKKAYHLEYGLIDQAVAGYPVTRTRYRDFLPPNLRLWVIPSGNAPGLVTQLLTPQQRLEDAGYVVYVVSGPSPP